MVLLKSLSPPAEGIRHQQAETSAVLDGKGLGTGTLYVAESCLSWFNGSGMGFSLEYPSISLHAISRDLNVYPQEHLYVMVNKKLNDETDAEMQEKDPGSEEDSDDSDEDPVITEIRFVPSDKAALESMFSTMCDCQALHPDPEDAESDNEDFDGEEYEEEESGIGSSNIPSFYTYEEGLAHLTVEGQATLQRLEGMLAQSVTEQFHMAGVRTDEPSTEFGDEMEVDPNSTVAGQFEDADVEHCRGQSITTVGCPCDIIMGGSQYSSTLMWSKASVVQLEHKDRKILQTQPMKSELFLYRLLKAKERESVKMFFLLQSCQ